PIPVNLPSPAISAGNVAGPSTNPIPESRDKGKGKAVFPDPEPVAEGSKKRKSPLISGLSSQPPKSVMKSHKRQRSGRLLKSKRIVESEDDDDLVVQPLSCGVPEVVLPRLSTIVARTPNLPRSLRAPTKKPFGPARVISGSHPAVMEPSQPTPKPPVQAPPVMPVVDILIPTQITHVTLATSSAGLAQLEDQVHPHKYGIPTSSHSCSLYHPEDEVHDTIRAPSKTPSKAPTASHTPAPPKLHLPPHPRPELATQTHGRSKTITAIKPPAPAPAAALAVPAAALGVPMPDLHAMSHAI
ncbi:hypothetical protein BDR03DRAFT_1018648, partial [Suillus americanus]